MLKQYLLYVNSDCYNYDKLELISSCGEDNVQPFNDYVQQYQRKLINKSISELLVVEMVLEPRVGSMQITRNDYFSNPLKQKIEINIAAKRVKPYNSPLLTEFTSLGTS